MDLFDFSKRIRELRKSKNLTAAQMEEAVRLSGGSWSRYERSLTMPSLAVASKIADFFGVSLDELAGRDADIAHIGVTTVRHTEKRLGRQELEKAWLVGRKVWDIITVDDPETRYENMKVIDMIAELLEARSSKRHSESRRITLQ